jgi:putative transposase
MNGRAAERAFRYRCYPSDEQARELLRTFGCVRLVYNRALEGRTTAWRHERRRVSYNRSAFRWRDGELTLAKMTRPLAIRWSRPLPEGCEPTTVTVSRDGAGRWHVSLTCGCGATRDRDVNAAKNILAAGLAVTACGDGAGPRRARALPGSGR